MGVGIESVQDRWADLDWSAMAAFGFFTVAIL